MNNSSQEIRAEGWQRDYGKLTGTVSELAAERRRHRDQATALAALVLSWRARADACCMPLVAEELRRCAAGVDDVMGEQGA